MERLILFPLFFFSFLNSLIFFRALSMSLLPPLSVKRKLEWKMMGLAFPSFKSFCFLFVSEGKIV